MASERKGRSLSINGDVKDITTKCNAWTCLTPESNYCKKTLL